MASFSASLPTPSVSFLRAWSFVGAACLSVEGGTERREGSWREVVVAGETLGSDEPELKRLHQYVTFGSGGLLSATTTLSYVVVEVDGSCGLEEKDEKLREVVVCAELSLMLRVCFVVLLLVVLVLALALVLVESSRGFGGTWITFSSAEQGRRGEREPKRP